MPTLFVGVFVEMSMRTEDEVRDRLKRLERSAYEHAAGCGEAPSETQAEIGALRWVLNDE